MRTAAQLFAMAQDIETSGYAVVTQCDRDQMAVALFFQGYPAGRACQIAFVELEDNDGALQMLARHRIAAAPDLLAALQEARAALHQHYVDWDGEPEDAVPLSIARDNCDKAIAAATGEGL